MLQLRDVSKAYRTGSFTQVALDAVSVCLRDNEFVAVLGPSGSGKTTLLNILGGLDRADSGDIIINGVSTKSYRPRDWDNYRNHRVGFVFQSYNLIPHQSILSNVELALTLSGVGRAERRRRAVEALTEVGLAEHVHKRPSQLSGGQMQRVAIARALVNDPDIVLADEPTGALDSETGIQVMDILKRVADDRLVVMVTHNPELAEGYATRIIRVQDGRIDGDTDPLSGDAALAVGTSGMAKSAIDGAAAQTPVFGGLPAGASDGRGEPDADVTDVMPPVGASRLDKRRSRRASMGFLTALSLSFNNLMTKKGRTALTAFAGSIGIIGIAAILALSNGVNNYITKTEEDALSSYPLTINKSSLDVATLLSSAMGTGGKGSSESSESDQAGVDGSGEIRQTRLAADMFAKVKSNDLASFKRYLEGDASDIGRYAADVQYGYGIAPQVFESDSSKGIVRLNPSETGRKMASGAMGSALTGGSTNSSFSELVDDRRLLESQLRVVRGRWPEAADEAVLTLDKDGCISDYTLYSLGFYDPDVMRQMTQQMLNGEEVKMPDNTRAFTYDDAMGMTFKVIPASALYQKNEAQGTWTDMSGDEGYMRERLDEGITLRVVGVVRPSDAAGSTSVREGISYTSALTRRLIQESSDSQIVREQLANPDVDVFTGKAFEELRDSQGRAFDMSSMFTIDQGALKRAFSFDSSALGRSAADMGELDLSGVSLDPSGFDMSSMSLDTSALASIFDADTMSKILGNAPKFDLARSGLADLGTGLTDEQAKRITQAANKLASGFIAWMEKNHPGELGPWAGPGPAAGSRAADAAGVSGDTPSGPAADGGRVSGYVAYLREYLSNDETAKEVLAELRGMLGEEASRLVEGAMQDYLTKQFVPYFSEALGSLMSEAAQAMATQLALQMQQQMAAATGQLGTQLSSAISGQLQKQMATLSSAMQDGFSVDPTAFASAIRLNVSQDDLTSLLTNFMNAKDLSYESDLKKLGYADVASPESIRIYPKDFKAKQGVLDIIDGYNRKVSGAGDDSQTIQYTDIAGTLMSSVTSIVDMVSLVLIAFVSISLVVSSIMIGIITHISVLERRKEIGILRAMGASKLGVANIFNAETVIEGLFSGVLAMAVVYVVSVPVNSIVEQTQKVSNIMALTPQNALALIAVSVVLTLVAGTMPAMSAARRDPVEALRSE